ncbi:MAG: ribonuclease Y [Thermoanaerobaculaceae bacterium]
MFPLVMLAASGLLILVGGVFLFGAWRWRKKAIFTAKQAEEDARRLLAAAEQEAQQRIRDGQIAAREKLLAARSEFDRETRLVREELIGLERKLSERETELAGKAKALLAKEEELRALALSLEERETQLSLQEDSVAAMVAQARSQLERVAGLTAEQAKQELVKAMENEARMEAAKIIRRIEEEANQEANNRAKKIIGTAIQRLAPEYVAEATVSVVDLPNDEMKGRIIGREGRNIRALENATGVDFIIDDTPGAVTLSCFDPLRREVARVALERLLADGRIHPARIEEVVAKVQGELEEKMFRDGEAAAMEMGFPDLHPELMKLMGRLQYRTSYGQNVLAHSKEVARIAAHLAEELGANVKVAKRAAFLHDIGKAVDREMEGTHLTIGRELLRQYGESEEVIHAMECHHGDVEPRTLEAIVVTAADATSAARPGARKEILESYLRRLEQLEGIAAEFSGVQKAYAIQAGRELRIIVEAERVSDEEAVWLSRDIARRIEKELSYPGQIKVTVIREVRFVEYAK